ncbi:MAG: 23S rRNA (guanosine(2251)-2'-O)-methyltransferase RlmB [Cryobacterium sp.]|nr:23S rRNA (guanosine(2251)-2'-O)-methyltransferase RlmB [Cryobacterium sp.]MBX3089442.1 23S rRNA (guanosine(2251)-2'-O)-methyltransferase RlmB [Cryobacterium sp.]
MKTPGARRGRPGAVRKKSRGPQAGSGGQGRQALEGKGPTPKAEDRPYHPAAKQKARAEKAKSSTRSTATSRQSKPKAPSDSELVTGRNSVVEALRARIPVASLYLASRIEYDDRVKEILAIATQRGLPILEVMRPELDRMVGRDAVHQGVALKIPPYEYADPIELFDSARPGPALLVALDGVTDPRNLGAVIRSVAAFGGHGVIVPQRRSAGMTAAAWKTSAGAAVRVKVALAGNLTQTLKSLKQCGAFVVGLDGDGPVALPKIDFTSEPLVVVAGSEGKGLSRLVAETCDTIVSIPISSSTESLNAGIAVSIALYGISTSRTVG